MPKMPESEKKEEESAESREEKKEQVCNEQKVAKSVYFENRFYPKITNNYLDLGS